jgi:hypothetical protein
MTGKESGTTTLRSYNAEFARGTGLYVSDGAGAITQNLGNEWSSMTITGIMSASAASWYTSSKQVALAAGYIPYHNVWELAHQHNLSSSMPYRARGAWGSARIHRMHPRSSTYPAPPAVSCRRA